jgi:hypothetical protein
MLRERLDQPLAAIVSMPSPPEIEASSVEPGTPP